MDPAEAEPWLDERLSAAGRRRAGPLELFRSRPWADIFTAPTDGGAVWLKVPGATTRFEVGLYAVLGRVVPGVILEPLGVDVERGWLLLPDSGPVLGQDYDTAATEDLAAAMERYGAAQLALSDHVDALLAAGVTDMRPAVMPHRFDEAIAAGRRYVASRGRDGDERILAEAEALRPRFADRCAELAARPGAPSLDHNDMHALNILGRPGAPDSLRFFDWGDSVLAHPFACLLVPLGIVARRGPEDIERVLGAYLSPFASLDRPGELRRTVQLACWVGKVARALVWERAVLTAADDVDDDFARAPFEHVASLRVDGFAVPSS